MSTLIYCALPVDQARRDMPWNRVAAAVVAEAQAHPTLVAFHPGRAFTVGPDTGVDARLERINREALDNADGVLAILPAGVPTIGTPREIESAVAAGKPVAVLTDLTDRSWSLADVVHFPMTIPAIDEAFKFLLDQAGTGELNVLDPYEIAFTASRCGRMPTRHSRDDAGYDLYVSRDTTIPPGEFVDVHTDVRVAMPSTMWARIAGRSSTRRNRGLLVIEGVIDPGYRGLLFSGVHNLTDKPVVVEEGERLAQLIPHINVAPGLSVLELNGLEFDALAHDGRGANGFGSSGA